MLLFFSATLSNEIRNIGKDLLINPKQISVNPYSSTSKNIDSTFIKTSSNNKMNDLKKLLYIDPIKSAVIFCNRKAEIEKVSKFLKKYNFDTVSLHGDMEQNLRIKSLEMFKDKSAKILIASDVAARGIDIDGLSHVFNYDVPNNPEDYVHRIGRTGRAGKKGTAVSFFVSEKNGRLARDLVAILNRTSQNIPNELQALASFSSGRGGRGRGRGRGRY